MQTIVCAAIHVNIDTSLHNGPLFHNLSNIPICPEKITTMEDSNIIIPMEAQRLEKYSGDNIGVFFGYVKKIIC